MGGADGQLLLLLRSFKFCIMMDFTAFILTSELCNGKISLIDAAEAVINITSKLVISLDNVHVKSEKKTYVNFTWTPVRGSTGCIK